ncbi:MAG: hypothetical protein OEV43_03275 [Coriobacteriia bacterium]|nr:hypothetical protein [Coriobacteriia bacterium]
MVGTDTARRSRVLVHVVVVVAVAVAIVAAALLAFRTGAEEPTAASFSSSRASSTSLSLEASAASTVARPAWMTSTDPERDDPDSTGASSDSASSENAAPADGASPVGGTPPAEPGTVPADAVSRIDIELGAPQTYRCEVEVLGWQSADAGVVALRIDDAELLGPIDPVTGEPRGEPDADAPDFAEHLRSLNVLSSTSPAAREQLEPSASVGLRLVLMPAGDGVTLFVDRVE